MEFKIINLNVWLGGKLMPQILDFLKQENANILNLQEVRRENSKNIPQIETLLREQLDYSYSFFAPAFFDTVENCDSGNLILSKFPIIKSETIFIYGAYSKHIHGQNPEYFPSIPRNLS